MAGFLAGFLAWIIMEPSSQPYRDSWEGQFILLVGALIGAGLGLIAGAMRRSTSQILVTGGLGLILGAVGASIGYQIGGQFVRVMGPSVLASPDISSLKITVRTMGIAPMAMFIGLGVGLASRKVKTAIVGGIGGLLAGLIAGSVFDPISVLLGQLIMTMTHSNEIGIVGRAITAVLTGAMTGLFIGLVERVSTTAWVRQVLGKNEGRDFYIDAPNTVMGRAEMADVPLMGDPSVYPQHCVIQKHRDAYFLTAIDPVQFVVLNGQPVKQAQLSSGDVFQVGTHVMQFFVKGQVMNRVQMPDVQRVAVAMPMGGGQPVGPYVSMGGGAPATPTAMPGPMPVTNQPTVAMPVSQPTVMATSSVTHEFLATSGPLTGQRFPIVAVLEIGREVAGISLAFDSMASRRHATLAPQADGVLVTDLGSTNGTLVNGTKVQSQLVRIGDTLTIGASTFRLEK